MRIFISDRQADTGGYCTELFRKLRQAFGDENVFFDVKSIALGDNWQDVVERRIQSCDLLLLPIGQQWLTIKDKKGRARLEDPLDPLRVEIEAARRASLRVIPLLIGTNMPEEDQLPDELRHLAKCVAFDLRHASFDRDLDHLISRLQEGLGGASESAEEQDAPVHRQAAAQATGAFGQRAGSAQPAQNPYGAPPFQAAINLTGTWQAATGILYSCWQQGTALVLESRNAFGVVVFRGQGTLTGNQIHLQYEASYQPPYVVHGEVHAVVSPDGLNVVGQTMDQATGVQPAQLRRIG